VSITQRHLDGLVSKESLDPPEINPRLHQARSTGMAQNVRHHMRVIGEVVFLAGLVPVILEILLENQTERSTSAPRFGQFHRLRCPIRQGNRAAFAGFGDPEGCRVVVNIAPFERERFADTGTGVNQKATQEFIMRVANTNAAKHFRLFFGIQKPHAGVEFT